MYSYMDPHLQFAAGVTSAFIGLYAFNEFTTPSTATTCLQGPRYTQDRMIPYVPPVRHVYEDQRPKVGAVNWWYTKTVVPPMKQDAVAHPPAEYAQTFPLSTPGVHDTYSLT
jgi:hypothetical protein